MGTRSEIYIRDEKSKTTIGLWKHWDGYPDFMIPLFERFLNYAYEKWREQPHWLTYPEDLAGLLIAWYYDELSKAMDELSKELSHEPVYNTDIRPFIDVSGRKIISDAEYVYIINIITERHNVIRYRILCYRLADWDGLAKDEIGQVKERGEIHSDNAILVENKDIVFKFDRAIPTF